MVSSANLMMLFLFWQVLSYMLYLPCPATMPMRRRLRRSEPSPSCGSATWHFCPASFSPISFTARWSSEALFAKAAESPVTLTPLPGIEIGGATAVTLLLFIGAVTNRLSFRSISGCPVRSMPRRRCMQLLHAGIINAGGFLINRPAPLYGLQARPRRMWRSWSAWSPRSSAPP